MERVKLSMTRNALNQVKQIIASTPGFDIVCMTAEFTCWTWMSMMGVYVNNERQQSEHNSGTSFPVIRKEFWEKALSQAQQDHKRQQRIQRDVHGENQNTHEQIKGKGATKALRAHERGASGPMKPHIVLSVPGVKSASKPRALTENTPTSWEMRNTFL